MHKGLNKVFKSVVNDISPSLPILGESGSEVSYLILELRHFLEVTILSEDMKKPWIKETMKEINNLINNQTFFSSSAK